MKKSCTQCSAQFEVTEDEKEFFKGFTPEIPDPELCPDCRSQQRAIFRNERTLYKRTCDLCNRAIVSIYHTSVPFPVFCPECFFSSKWDPCEIGQDFDETIPFFEQLAGLYQRAPRLSVMNKSCENSEYGNYVFANKNCYLLSGSHYNEDCLYGVASTRNKDCIDFTRILDCELCYQCILSRGCHSCTGVRHCTDCHNSYFSRDLNGCRNCIFCANLRHKEYHIFNKAVSPDEYKQFIATLRFDTHTGYAAAEETFTKKVQNVFPVRALYQVQCESSEGDDLQSCKGLRRSFSCEESEDCSYGFQLTAAFNCIDCDYIGYDRTEWCCQCIGCTGLFHSMSCCACWHGSDLYYCQYCHSTKNCIGCIAMQQKSFCILNKQYTENEYKRLFELISSELRSKGKWGKFFPQDLTTFGYNETVAQDWFSLTKDQATDAGYRWQAGMEDIGKVEKVIPAEKLPESIDDIPDDILNWGLQCPLTGKLFRLTKRELNFYRIRRLPVPHIYPEERHLIRMRLRSRRHLWVRNCLQCGKAMQTTYAPERPEKVYCEECYLKEVY